MNAVLGWLKSNILIVVFGVLIVLLPPAGVVGSMMWNKQIKASAEELYNSESDKLSRAGRVSYQVPPVIEGEDPISESRPPNSAVSRAYHAERERRQEAIERVVRAAVGFNRGEGRTVLVDGLFPDPPSGPEERRMTERLLDRVVGTDEVPSVYEQLLASINAGGPPEAIVVARDVTQFEERELDRLVGSNDRSALTDEQARALDEALVAQRIAAYRQRADQISLYATPAIFESEPGGGYSSIPTERPQSRPDMDEAFVMQMDYWAVEDLLTAVARANSEAGGLLTEVPRSVVKRIDSIRINEFSEALTGDASAGAGGVDPSMMAPGGPGFGTGRPPGGRNDPRGSFSAPAGGGFPGAVGGGAATTHTGRADAPSEVYDVRMIEVEAVVASSRMNEFLAALAATNFKTVTGMYAEEVDVWADLAQGYFYGPDHVLRVTLQIESIWLRQWTRDAMPAVVRDALGVALPEPIESDPGADGAAGEEAQP